jgi:simple sugar transport system ATP-binding protein
MNILVGLFPPDEGKIFLDGKEVRFSSPRDARSRGIEIVYQFGNLVEGLSIYKNFFLGREIMKKAGILRVLDRRKMREVSEAILNEIGINQDSKKLIEMIRDRTSMCMVFVTHNVRHVFHSADRIMVLDRGEKICDKRTEDTTIEEVAELIAKETVHLH